jgi:hypothetical protein
MQTTKYTDTAQKFCRFGSVTDRFLVVNVNTHALLPTDSVEVQWPSLQKHVYSLIAVFKR